MGRSCNVFTSQIDSVCERFAERPIKGSNAARHRARHVTLAEAYETCLPRSGARDCYASLPPYAAPTLAARIEEKTVSTDDNPGIGY